MSLTATQVSDIWDELELECPGLYTTKMIDISLDYHDENEAAEKGITFHGTIWELKATFLLLILAANGEL